MFVSPHSKRMARTSLESYSGLDRPVLLGSGVALIDASYIRGVKKFLSIFAVPPKPLQLWEGKSDPLRLVWLLMAQEGEPQQVVRDFAVYMDRLLQDQGLLELFQTNPAGEAVGKLEKIFRHDMASKQAVESGDPAKALQELSAALELAPRSHLFSTRRAQLLAHAIEGSGKRSYPGNKK